MNRRGGKDASERRKRVGEDERQSVMAWPLDKSLTKLVTLITLRKVNHLGKAGNRLKKSFAQKRTPWRDAIKKQRYSVRP